MPVINATTMAYSYQPIMAGAVGLVGLAEIEFAQVIKTVAVVVNAVTMKYAVTMAMETLVITIIAKTDRHGIVAPVSARVAIQSVRQDQAGVLTVVTVCVILATKIMGLIVTVEACVEVIVTALTLHPANAINADHQDRAVLYSNISNGGDR